MQNKFKTRRNIFFKAFLDQLFIGKWVQKVVNMFELIHDRPGSHFHNNIFSISKLIRSSVK